VRVMGTKRVRMKIIDNKDRIKVDPSSIPLYGKAWGRQESMGSHNVRVRVPRKSCIGNLY
jgi:hypothetical protein